MKQTLTPWLQAVERAVRAIPSGQTASYARVALMAGKPGAARAVVQALHRLEDLPWWRVVRSDGTLAPQVAREQRQKLEQEGLSLSPKGERVGVRGNLVHAAVKASASLTRSGSPTARSAPKTNSPSRSQSELRKSSRKKPK